MLQRWVSADPLTIHGLGADPNVYAYVRGQALRATDPLGLNDTGERLRALDAGVPPPPGTSMHDGVVAQYRGGGVTEVNSITITPSRASAATASVGSPIQPGAPGVPEVADAIGAAKGWYNTAVVGGGEAALWNTPGLNVWMAATGARPLDSVKAGVSGSEQSGAFVGTGLGLATPSAVGTATATTSGLKLTLPRVGQTGASANELLARIAKAERAYEQIRGLSDDVAAIASSTGMREGWVRRVKDHVFYKEHRLDEGLRRFHASPEIADAWTRMRGGKGTASDMKLMWHELVEARFESIFKTTSRQAHDAVRGKHPSGLE